VLAPVAGSLCLMLGGCAGAPHGAAPLAQTGFVGLDGSEELRRLERVVLVPSSGVPELLPPVVVTVRNGETVYDGMQGGGSTARPCFFPLAMMRVSNPPSELPDGEGSRAPTEGSTTDLPCATHDRMNQIVTPVEQAADTSNKDLGDVAAEPAGAIEPPVPACPPGDASANVPPRVIGPIP